MFSGNRKEEEKVKPARSNAMPSILAESLTIEGNLVSAGEIQIEGQVTGNLEVGSLIVGEKAVINGDISAGKMVIRGEVNGAMRGDEITVTSTAVIHGDIVHASLSIEPGAKIDGHLKHSETPRAQGGAGDGRDTVTFIGKTDAVRGDH
ncbi:MAG: hypothetical protein CMN55_12560 [Sneathiella sp.]|jgi:cytoskeletal protein CcmA (bactofilin family)|uniref:bactofilin family protein n=1 Tax=Sneathiella sp. TaxID=1964365 RepID=UPI000C3D45CA|nr:polymer-forming cytoskeletal protein [Sneathiella sp.]MAL79923.1 hypothetical protein [Sneathiella sp.]|tara:strand:- start:345 stop:791 length:447 start_codon:yes stop_codon:yes gene_type:complete